MSHLFLTKLLDGKSTRFLRFGGADSFVVEVNGAERTISREVWEALPSIPSNDEDRVGNDRR